MKRKKAKPDPKAFRFAELIGRLESLLGLDGNKIHLFVERIAKDLGPMLDNLEGTMAATRAVPLDVIKPVFFAYIKQVAKESGMALPDLQKTGAELMALLKEWFKPELFQEILSHLMHFYFFSRLESEVDEFGMDMEMVEAVRPCFQFLYEDYWRVEVEGIENIPDRGACMLVANHSGCLPYDGAMLTVACLNEHPAKRHVRFLIEDFVYHFPFMGTFMSRIGAVRACPENAAWLLKKKQLVVVFPEGIKGLGKLYSERYRLKRFGRGGFIRLAIKNKTPIVPVAILGAEEIHPVVWKSGILAKAMGVPYLPVTPTFPWLGPLGFIPLPSKWRIVFGEPIPFDRYKPSQAEDGLLVQTLSEQVRFQIQSMIDKGLKKRRSVWLG